MRRWSFIVGAVLVAIGVLAILQAGLGILGIHFRIGAIFWPLVLIAVGAWIIVGINRGRGVSDDEREHASLPLEGARQAAVTIHHGAGRLAVGPGPEGDVLLAGTFGGGLDADRRRDGDRLVVDMRVRDRDVGRWFFGPWRRGWAGILDWDVALNPGIPLSLRVETGANESRLFLTELQVRELLMKTGASSTTIELPARAPHTRVSVESGVAAVKIHVPQGVAAAIVVRSTLAGVHVDTLRFPGSIGGYRSPDFDASLHKVEIFIETALGSVEIT